jgi:long-chain acyl-CoA synthetase
MPEPLELGWTPATTLDILDRAAAARPNATALICGEARLTYAEYRHIVDALAWRWRGARGRVIVLALRNGLEIAVAIFAAQRAGATVATLNPDYTVAELAPLIEDAAPALILTHAALAETLAKAAPGAILETVDAEGAFLAALLTTPKPPPLPPIDPDTDAVLQFTGGTTGRSKGALLTHRAVATNVAQRDAMLPTVFGDEVVVSAMPLFHVFAVAMGLHLAAYAAGTLVILPRFRPDWLVDAVEARAGTRLPAGPTVFNALLGFEGLDRKRLASLRCCYSGSAPLSHDTLTRWEAAVGAPIYEGYGQSEAGPVLTYAGPAFPRKIGSVGRALPHTDVEIVDAQDGQTPLPVGGVGEIRAKGPQIMHGYLNRPDATAETLRDGWLYTGDIGRLDADGDLFIEDRKKDMVIVGGYNVYPREIDEVLARHPAVVEAAAVGAPDSYRGERVVAFVCRGAGQAVSAEDLQAHCAASLTKYKLPADIRFLDALPRTPVGKVDKPALRALARQERTP